MTIEKPKTERQRDIERIVSKFNIVRKLKNEEWQATCPCHDDNNPSLFLTAINDRMLIKCFSGCLPEDICEAVGLSLSDLFFTKTQPTIKLDFNQQFVAELCVDWFVGDIVYCRDRKKWFYWDEFRWASKGGYSYVKRQVIKAIQAVPDIAKTMGHTDYALAIKWTNGILKDNQIDQIMNLIAVNEAVERCLDDFDQDRYLINFVNGTLNLKTKKLQPHNRNDLITRICPVEYDSKAKCRMWDGFIKHVTNGDKRLENLIKSFFGYCLTGNTREELFGLIYGPTWTGKSTLIEAIRSVFGEYMYSAPFQTFIKNSNPLAPRPILAKLPGVRLITVGEFPPGTRLDTALMKTWTGGEQITCRPLYGKPFSYYPQGKILFITNDCPASIIISLQRQLFLPLLHNTHLSL